MLAFFFFFKSIFSKEIQLLKKLQERAASGYVFFLQRRLVKFNVGINVACFY